MIEATFSRLDYLTNGLKHLARALEPLSTAAGLVSGTGHTGDTYAGELSALVHLADAQHTRLSQIARECAGQLGWQVATYEIAPIARESGDDPIAWITGNSMMPPLREFGLSNSVWNLDYPDLWQAYAEAVESRLDELKVYLGAPEYDNALYVVDLARFESRSDEEMTHLEAAELADEWKPIEP